MDKEERLEETELNKLMTQIYKVTKKYDYKTAADFITCLSIDLLYFLSNAEKGSTDSNASAYAGHNLIWFKHVADEVITNSSHYQRELFKWIPEYEGRYLVSNKGYVISIPAQAHTAHILKSYMRNNHLHVSVYKNGKTRRFKVSSLVGNAFSCKYKEQLAPAYIDGDRQNCSVENLSW